MHVANVDAIERERERKVTLIDQTPLSLSSLGFLFVYSGSEVKGLDSCGGGTGRTGKNT